MRTCSCDDEVYASFMRRIVAGVSRDRDYVMRIDSD